MLRKIFVFVFLFAFAVASAQAAVIMVPEDYETIQQAVWNAGSGDTIMVGPGTYVGAQIAFTPGLKIVGSGNETAITAGYGGTPRHAFYIWGHKAPTNLPPPYPQYGAGDGTVISNLKIECNSEYLWFGVYGRGADNVKVSHLTIVDATQAISCRAGDGWEITHNRIVNLIGFCPYALVNTGIQLLGDSRYGDGKSENNLVAFNNIDGTNIDTSDNIKPRFGIFLATEPFYPADVKNNKVVHNNAAAVDGPEWGPYEHASAGITLIKLLPIPGGDIADNIIGFNDVRGSSPFQIFTLGIAEDANDTSRNLGVTENRAFDPEDMPAPYFNPQPPDPEAP